jgi:hypothetical protein
MARQVQQRAEDVAFELRPVCEERCKQAPIGVGVLAEALRRLIEGAADDDGGAVIERVGKRGEGLDQC